MDIEDDHLPPESPRAPVTPSWLRPVAIGGSVGLVLVAALFGWILTRPGQDGARSGSPDIAAAPARTGPAASDEAAGPASVARQTGARRLAGWQNAPLAVFDAEAARPGPLVAPLVVLPPYDAIDAILFDTADTRIRLSGVLPVARDEVCFDTEHRRFACGLQARASLQNFMRNKTVLCRPVFGAGERRDGIVEAHCSADGLSLALHQVAAGFAFPVRTDPGPLATALEEARAKRLGVWGGDYQIPAVDRSEADSKAIRFGAARLSQSPFEMPQAPVKPNGKR